MIEYTYRNILLLGALHKIENAWWWMRRRSSFIPKPGDYVSCMICIIHSSVWLSVQTVHMKATGFIINNKKRRTRESGFKDLKGVLGWLTGLQHLKPIAHSMLTVYSVGWPPWNGTCTNFGWFTSMLRIIRNWIIQIIWISSTFQFYIGNNRHILDDISRDWQIWMIYHMIDKSSTFGWFMWITNHPFLESPTLPQHGLMCRDHMPALRTNCLFYNVNLLKSLWLPNHFCLCMYGKGVNYEWCGATQESPPICPARACSYAMGTQVLVKHHTQTMY